jgi:hypothetical protein
MPRGESNPWTAKHSFRIDSKASCIMLAGTVREIVPLPQKRNIKTDRDQAISMRRFQSENSV